MMYSRLDNQCCLVSLPISANFEASETTLNNDCRMLPLTILNFSFQLFDGIDLLLRQNHSCHGLKKDNLPI
eukprot:10589.XXX_412594_412806_1 [CDS] Oithona nana genome sequencing.